MDIIEARAWLAGERSMTNTIPIDPRESWLVRIAQADAAQVQEAYWIAKAHKDGLLADDPVGWLEKNAPIDTDPLSPEDEASLKRGLADEPGNVVHLKQRSPADQYNRGWQAGFEFAKDGKYGGAVDDDPSRIPAYKDPVDHTRTTNPDEVVEALRAEHHCFSCDTLVAAVGDLTWALCHSANDCDTEEELTRYNPICLMAEAVQSHESREDR